LAAHDNFSSVPVSRTGYRTTKLLAGENYYLHTFVKRKCHGYDLPELLLQRVEVGLSGLFLSILNIVMTDYGFACRFIPELCGKMFRVPADFSAFLVRFFAKNSAYCRKNAAECGKDSCFPLLYGRKYRESGDIEGCMSRRFCYIVKNCEF